MVMFINWIPILFNHLVVVLATIKQVIIAMRPWSFPMTIIVALATILYAYWLGYDINIFLSIIAIIGSVFLHATTNLINDYYDTKYNVDRPGVGTVEYRPHPLIHGYMTQTQVFMLGTTLAIIAIILAAISAIYNRPLAILLGLIGLILAYAYTAPPFKLKYIGLGEVAVYLAWGIVIPLGVSYLATGIIDYKVLAYISPIAILIVNVLLANNIRDAETDRKAGVMTIAARIGAKPTAKIFVLLTILAYLIPAILVILNLAPLPVLLPIITIPRALQLAKILETNPPPDADPRAADIATKYSILYIIGIIIQLIIEYL